MALVMFYHLTRSPVTEAVRPLLLRALGAGWRVMLRGTDPARLAALDEALWQGEGFLPHGLAGGAHDADQPVLLGQGAAANGAACLMAVDGAGVAAEEAAAMARVMILFDGNDDPATAAARLQWKSLTAAGLPAQYWSEEGGSWAKKAETPVA